MIRRAVTLACSLLMGAVCAQSSDSIAANSFSPPFKSFDSSGKRQIGGAWSSGADSLVHENFIRFTRDRASKRGYAWNSNTVPVDDWVAEISFRISGQGQRLYGDGLGFWFTTSPKSTFASGGDTMGGPRKFTGFAVLFDTFKNPELGVHKDVQLISSGGEDVDFHEAAEHPGCDSSYRYWEGRDDFSVASMSKARIVFRGSENNGMGTVKVIIDAKDAGTYTMCISGEALSGLPSGWYKDAHIAITASTGQLADNHDVLSLDLSQWSEDAASGVIAESTGIDFGAIEAAMPEELIALMKEYQGVLDKKLNHMHHHVEHQLSSVHDSLKNTISKLRAAEKKALDDIRAQEEKVAEELRAKELENEKRIAALEERLHLSTSAKIEMETRKHSNKMLDQVKDDLSVSSGGGWFMPFLILVCGIVGFVGYVIKRMKKLESYSKII